MGVPTLASEVADALTTQDKKTSTCYPTQVYGTSKSEIPVQSSSLVPIASPPGTLPTPMEPSESEIILTTLSLDGLAPPPKLMTLSVKMAISSCLSMEKHPVLRPSQTT